MKYFILVLLLLTSCATPEPKIQKLNEHDYKIVGKLDKFEYDEIISIVKSHQNQTVNFYVSSIGGTSSDLFEAMDAVYYHGQIHWYSLNYCDSACAVMALSTKHAHGHFRLHSFYSHHHYEIKASPEFNEKILNRLDSYGYDKSYLNHMFHSVEEMWPFTMNENVLKEE